MYPHIQTSPLAGMRLSSHLRALLLLFGVYRPPSNLDLRSSTRSTSNPKPTRVPEDLLTEELIEEIKTRCCYVGNPLPASASQNFLRSAGSSSPPPPPSSDPPESEDTSIEMEETDPHISTIDKYYGQHSKATELRMRVKHPNAQSEDMGLGTLVIPGWIRERAAELLFEDGDLDEQSVVEVVLRSLRKVLRKH